MILTDLVEEDPDLSCETVGLSWPLSSYSDPAAPCRRAGFLGRLHDLAVAHHNGCSDNSCARREGSDVGS